MPIFVAPPSNEFKESVCDYENLDKNKLVETKLESAIPLKECYNRFEDKSSHAISQEDASVMIRYSNFLTTEVLKVAREPGCVFIRVFNGIHQNGQHFTFLVPVGKDGMPIKNLDTRYLAQCCACPPSCTEDGGLS